MATNTPNINLVKPAYTDNADIGVVNANSDKIDAAVKALQDLVTALQTSTTPQAILNAIKTVDGLGSGLDADLLDGKHATDFVEKTGGIMSGALEVGLQNSSAQFSIERKGTATGKVWMGAVASNNFDSFILMDKNYQKMLDVNSFDGSVGVYKQGTPSRTQLSKNDGNLQTNLNSDLLDGKHATDFHPNLITIANVSLNNYKTTGKFYFSTGCSDLPSGITEYVMVDVFGDGEDAVQIATSIYFNKVFTRTKLRAESNWKEWKEVGSNLFTVPRQFSITNATAGQTVFSYSGGAGEVITTTFSNSQPILVIDGTELNYSGTFPFSTNSQNSGVDIRIKFKNSIVIKTKGLESSAVGLIMTEK